MQTLDIAIITRLLRQALFLCVWDKTQATKNSRFSKTQAKNCLNSSKIFTKLRFAGQQRHLLVLLMKYYLIVTACKATWSRYHLILVSKPTIFSQNSSKNVNKLNKNLAKLNHFLRKLNLTGF